MPACRPILTQASGFSLTEVVVAVAILAVLAGGMTPLVFNQIEKARRTRAMREISILSEAVMTFREDVKTFPDRRNGQPAQLGYLVTSGSLPGGLGRWGGPSGRVADHLLDNTPAGATYPVAGIAAWRGPYLVDDFEDPWGRAYVLSVAGMRGTPGVRGWVLSAGPDGQLDTDDGANQLAAGSDDLGWRLR